MMQSLMVRPVSESFQSRLVISHVLAVMILAQNAPCRFTRYLTFFRDCVLSKDENSGMSRIFKPAG